MREFVHFSITVGRQPPPRWQDIAMAALQPYGPTEITPSPYGDRGIEFEFDLLSRGPGSGQGPTPAPGHQQHVPCPPGVHRRGATPGGAGHPGRWADCKLGRGHVALGGGFDLSLLRLPDG